MSQSPAATAAAPDGATRRQWLTLLVLSLGLAIVIIDGTIVNVAIPSIQKEFDASFKSLEWVNSIYSLVFASLIITWGRIGDQVGRKRIFIAGITVFVLGSVFAGASRSINMLIAARAIQGLGAAMTSPSTLSIISGTFIGKMRGVAFGVWGAVAGAAAALGPLLGGWLTTNASWRWAFYINIPIGIAAVIGAALVIQESRETRGKVTFDIPGIILVGLGVGAVVFGLIEGQTYGWLKPKLPFTIGNWTWPFTEVSVTVVAFVVGAVALALFVWWELRLQRRGSDPLFDFTLMRFRSFRFGLITVSIVALGEFGLVFVLSIFLQTVRGLTAFQTGLILLPFALMTLLVAPTAGIFSSRFGPKWVVTTGMLVEAIAIFAISRTVSLTAPLTVLIAFLMVYGVGVGLAIAQLTNVVLSEVPYDRLGAGSGANNTIRQIGAAMGIAIIGAVLTSTLAASATTQLQATQVIPAAAKTAILRSLQETGGAGEGASLKGAPAGFEKTAAGKEISQIIKQSFVDGARRAGEVASVFVLLGAISSLFIPNTSQRRTRVVVPAE
jgi:EmrB/QacA subfamily drug resistance transporter